MSKPWTGPVAADYTPGTLVLRQPVPPERWPLGLPADDSTYSSGLTS